RGAHGDALLLAPRKLSWSRAAPVGEPDALEELVGACEPGRRRNAAQTERQRDELASGELGCERARVVLVGVADRRRAERRAPARAAGGGKSAMGPAVTPQSTPGTSGGSGVCAFAVTATNLTTSRLRANPVISPARRPNTQTAAARSRTWRRSACGGAPWASSS